MKAKATALLALSFFYYNWAVAEEVKFGVHEKTDEYISEDILLAGSDSNIFKLKDKIDKVTILALVYYNCDKNCNSLLHGLTELVNNLTLQCGKDYQVFVVSFDPDENIDEANKKKTDVYKSLYNKKTTGLYFCATDSANSAKLTSNVGYGYIKNENDYIHSNLLIVISPTGKIINYMFGDKFLTIDFEMTYKDALIEKSKHTVPRDLPYCTNYIPVANHILHKIATVFGIITLLFAISLFLILVLGKKIKN